MESSYLHNPENIKPKEPTLEEVRSNLYREMSIKEPQAVEYSLDEIPSEEAKLQNTKTFKDWYHGPVDDKGNPKMFWHSTGDYFLKFNPDFMYRGRGFLNLGAGFYLGEDKTPLSFYKDIAKQKIPDDENRKIKIENLNTRMSRIQSIASHMKKKASVETNQEYKLIEALLSEEEILRKDRLDFIKENPNYTNYAYDESISQLKKRYLKRIFDNTYRKIYELHSHGEELRAKRNVQYKIASEKEGKLKKIVEKEKNLLNKLRSVIDSLMPEGATLRCYANIDKILDFNESVDKTVITNIRQAL
jgi:hypothetical protein